MSRCDGALSCCIALLLLAGACQHSARPNARPNSRSVAVAESAKAVPSASDPFAWQGEPYQNEADAVDLQSAQCEFIEAEIKNAVVAGTPRSALPDWLRQAGQRRGDVAAACVRVFLDGMEAYSDAMRNAEAVTNLKNLAISAAHAAQNSPSCLATAPPVPVAWDLVPYAHQAADWQDAAWTCLRADYNIAGAQHYFRYAFYYRASDRHFVAAAQRLDRPDLVLFVQRGVDQREPVVVRKLSAAASANLLIDTYHAAKSPR